MAMSWASSEIVGVFVFLLPGFVAAAVFYSLSSYPKPNEFGQVVQALVFTMVGQLIAVGIQQLTILLGAGSPWPSNLEIIVPTLSAVAFALIVVYASNNDIPHRLLRLTRLTRENSYASEWYFSFVRNADCYVVLHLKDERRLYGWPEDWPKLPGQGHFRIIEGEWLDAEARGDQDDSLDNNEREIFAIMVPAEDVKMVEFIDTENLNEATE